MKKAMFKQWLCDVVLEKYSSNNRIAIELVCEGELITTATTNIPTEPLEENEVILKTWSENEMMHECLFEAGIVGPVKRYVHTGFVKAPVCELLIGTS